MKPPNCKNVVIDLKAVLKIGALIILAFQLCTIEVKAQDKLLDFFGTQGDITYIDFQYSFFSFEDLERYSGANQINNSSSGYASFYKEVPKGLGFDRISTETWRGLDDYSVSMTDQEISEKNETEGHSTWISIGINENWAFYGLVKNEKKSSEIRKSGNSITDDDDSTIIEKYIQGIGISRAPFLPELMRFAISQISTISWSSKKYYNNSLVYSEDVEFSGGYKELTFGFEELGILYFSISDNYSDRVKSGTSQRDGSFHEFKQDFIIGMPNPSIYEESMIYFQYKNKSNEQRVKLYNSDHSEYTSFKQQSSSIARELGWAFGDDEDVVFFYAGSNAPRTRVENNNYFDYELERSSGKQEYFNIGYADHGYSGSKLMLKLWLEEAGVKRVEYLKSNSSQMVTKNFKRKTHGYSISISFSWGGQDTQDVMGKADELQ